MPDLQQTLSDASIKEEGGQTVMRFTKIMRETGEIQITNGENTFLWAHGSGPSLGYHEGRKSIKLNLSSGSAEAVAAINVAAWLSHGIIAFLGKATLILKTKVNNSYLIIF